MQNNSVIFFTDFKDKHHRLLDMLKSNYTVDVCTYKAESWTDIDFYSNNNIAFVLDNIPQTKEADWILSKLSEDGLFANTPILFTSYEAMYDFENSGFVCFAYDVLPEPFDYDLAYRRFQNLSEISQLKSQIYNLSQIHTKRILNQANKLKEQSARMHTINHELVELLVAAIESRDLESGQHIKRIRFFTKALTDSVMNLFPEYGITKEQAELIYYASSVHDIGKIAIPDAIMLKPGRLTADEFEVMKTHTVRGFTLLNMLDGISEQNEYFKYCQEICHYHHERWDGKGYPEGLKGDETPISAQIVAVCDCYDALTSNRPYKPALSHHDAVDLIMNGGCGAFSPKILKSFSAVLEEFARIEKEFKSQPSTNEESVEIVVENTDTQSVESILSGSEKRIVEAHDIIFHVNLLNDSFTVLQGDWNKLFVYHPKNYTEAVGQCLKVCHPADAARFTVKVDVASLSEIAKTGQTKTRIEFRIVQGDEDYLAVGFFVFETDDDMNLIGFDGVFNIYNDNEVLTDIKQGFGVTDTLTGIPLQKQFEKDVNSFLKDKPDSKNLLIHIDIDNMSFCNNIFGYEYGNALIKEFASKLRGTTSKNQILCKAASDKFLLFVKDIKSQAEIVMFIENLHNLLQKPYQTGTESGVFTASMGIARYPNDAKNFKNLAIASEYAAKVAKSNGGDSYAFFNPNMQNLANLSPDGEKHIYKSDKEFELKYIPVVDAKTNRLICYDFFPFSDLEGEGIVSPDSYYEINKNSPNTKTLSIISIKTLVYKLIDIKASGKSIPPISVYTMLSSDDLPSFMQELKTLVTENDCTGVDLTLLLPQDVLDEISVGRLKSLSDYIHKIGFKLGVFLIGTRYIHNKCHMYGVFDRYVVKSQYIEHTVGSNGNMKYCADTLSILKKFVNVLSIPCKVSDYEKQLVFSNGFSDFTVELEPVSGTNALLADYESRIRYVPDDASNKRSRFKELDPAISYYDILNSELVLMFYDVKTNRINITPNAKNVFGFDVFKRYLDNDTASLFSLIHPDDVEHVISCFNQIRMNPGIDSFTARIVTGENNDVYQKFTITVICATDESGAPIRYQCALAKVHH